MWPEVRGIPLEHRLNGHKIGAHLRYTYVPAKELLSVVYVVDDPVHSSDAKHIYNLFQEEILHRLANDMDMLGIPHPRKTRVIIIPGYVTVI